MKLQNGNRFCINNKEEAAKQFVMKIGMWSS